MNMLNEINPFDILSGKVVQNEYGTFWFKEAGHNLKSNGRPIIENLHREHDLPAAIGVSGSKSWWYNGKRHRINGPAVVWLDGYKEWYIMGKEITEEEFNEYVKRNKPI